MKFFISDHARERMDQRGIALPLIRAVLEHGAIMREPNGYYKRELNGFVVVTDGNIYPPVTIITVYERQEE